MKKESSCIRTPKGPTSAFIPNPQLLLSREKISLNRNQFLNWTNKLALEQRYVALRLKMPTMVDAYRELLEKKLQSIKTQQGALKKPIFRNFKVLEDHFQAFLDSLVFMTDERYLDCIGFDYSCVSHPQKIFDLLKAIEKCLPKKFEEKYKVSDIIEQNKEKEDKKMYESRQEWIVEVAHQIERALAQKIKQNWNPKIFQQQKNHKKQFVGFWKSMNEEERELFLRFNSPDDQILQNKINNLSIALTVAEIDSEIDEIMKAEKKQLCNRIFKWKLKKNNPLICSYYENLFRRWKELCKAVKNKKKSYENKKKKNGIRNKSIDAMSNQTNETENKEAKFQVNFKSFATEKLERDLQFYSNFISENANSFFERRVLAYERLKYLLEHYGIYIKLYGSCACGIAIQNSDLDVAVDQSILNAFNYYDQDPHQKIKTALASIKSILEVSEFVSQIVFLENAYIPILKFRINTTSQFYSQEPEIFYHLNREIILGGTVQVDLTIETKNYAEEQAYLSKPLPMHLGVKSTDQINRWLDEFETLRPILLILKHQLKINSLNQTYKQGLNTYSLLVMLVAALKNFQLQKETKISSVLGKILLFYSQEFDETEYGIQLTGPLIFYRKQVNLSSTKFKSADLEVKDPLNKGKIMTKNCYKFYQIKQLFNGLYNAWYIQTQLKVQQIFSGWNQKKQKIQSSKMTDWVLDNFKQNIFQPYIS